MIAAGTAVASAAPPAASTNCTDVGVGSARSYGCLNRSFARTARQTHPVSAIPDVTATSSPVRVGTYNQAAVREHLGGNFGHSVFPPTVMTPAQGPH